MHGRVKVLQSDEQKKKAKAEKAEKLARFAELETQTLENYKNKNADFLANSRSLLEANPNCFVFWNQRRLYLLENHLKELPQDDLLHEELRLTRNCLLKDPKSYGAWFHRNWILNAFKVEDLSNELALCNEFLTLDERNFHCWDYRRGLVSKMSLPKDEDIKFTSNLLDRNFSNFSAWHYRSELLVPSEKQVNISIHLESSIFKPDSNELDLIHNAIFTDAIDQSAWFAYWRLFNEKKRLITLNSVTIAKEHGLILVRFSAPIISDQLKKITFSIESDTPLELTLWKSVNASEVSSVWLHSLSQNLIRSPIKLAIAQGDHRKSVQFELNQVTIAINEEIQTLNFNLTISPNIDKTLLQEELTLMLELYEMEPTNKWVLLTLVNMLAFLKPQDYLGSTTQYLNLLKELDRPKVGFYKVFQSHIIVNDALSQYYKSLGTEFTDHFVLANSNITALPNLSSLYHIIRLDLSSNELESIPATLQHLPLLKELKLSKNFITSLENIPKMPNLLTLSLDFNQLSKKNLIENLFRLGKYSPKLKEVDLIGNPVTSPLTGIENLSFNLKL